MPRFAEHGDLDGRSLDQYQSLIDDCPWDEHAVAPFHKWRKRYLRLIVDSIPGLAHRRTMDQASFSLFRAADQRQEQFTRNEERVIDNQSVVAVVDDSESVRESLPDLLEQFGFVVEAFASAEAFLDSGAISKTSCLILDVGLPGMSGPDLQQELIRRGHALPIVFITAQGDASLRPRLLAAGAVACLFKPFSDTALLDALNTALRKR